MKKYKFEQAKIFGHLFYWTITVVPMAVVVGSMVALFLWLLDVVTVTRWNNLWLVWLLPLAGLLITFIYTYFGKNAEAGNNLVIDEIHKPGGGIPTRMAPLVFISTLITHLFGGSAGREGTAVQMGGSIASLFAKMYTLHHQHKRVLLMSGMAAGFGAVFGTPVAGAIFAMEVLASGRIKYDALLPCLTASVIADVTCRAFGIHHTAYTIAVASGVKNENLFALFDGWLLVKVLLAGVAFGLAAYLFSTLTKLVKMGCKTYINNQWFVPVAGGILVIGISYLLGSFDYLGLGVVNPAGGVSIVSAFQPGGATQWSWLWKLLLTAITIGTGFKGGEVTPLFFIGATLGNIIAMHTGAPMDLFAALGFIAVFAGATNTPIACTLMGVELFGGTHVLYFAVVCFTAYYFSGHTGIYSSQRIAINKLHQEKDNS